MATPSMNVGSNTREVVRKVRGQSTSDGAGVRLTRVIGTGALDSFDPFLLLDEFRSDNPNDYLAGFPNHPHRGFETVTYMLDGEFEHEDSAGHKGTIAPGDVQWMTAGRGVVHSEMPTRLIREKGGRLHGFQLWVNLPARDKMIAPRYQEVKSAGIPEATSPDGLARVRVIAGAALGVRAVIDTRIPITYQDWTLQPGAVVEQAVDASHHAITYVFQGKARIGRDARELKDGQLGILDEGDSVRLEVPADATGPARLLLLSGRPIGEQVARYGPFVMNTEAEIMQAIEDYRAGRLGEIARV
jgi:hypothetical protein